MPARRWIEVNDLYCKGCELCIAACPIQVMALDKGSLTPKGTTRRKSSRMAAPGGAICALVCRCRITVYRELTKASAAAAVGG